MAGASRKRATSANFAAAAARPNAQLELRLGHVFARPELLALALTHRSATYEARHGAPPDPQAPMHPVQRSQRNAPGSDNEQMEFLGDAVIGLVITEALVRHFPDCSEGELTRLRSALVSRKRLGELGLELELDRALRLGRSAEYNGGRQKPALLANATEAVFAAVYLDANTVETPTAGLAAMRRLADRYLVQPGLAALREALAKDTGRGAMRDAKTLLQERVQASAQGGGQRLGGEVTSARLLYIDTAQSGPAHQRRFSVEAQLRTVDGAGTEQTRTLAAAEGGSKKEAQQRAAELALAALDAEAAV